MIKILYIEDDVMIGKTTYQLLRHEKFEVDWAKTGLEALDFLFRQTYHLVLLDLGLPELEGLDVLKHIRKKSSSIRLQLLLSVREIKAATRFKG